LYFVLETRSTAPKAYAIFHELRQVTTVQSTNILKQSLNNFNVTFILFCIILHNLLDGEFCIKSNFKTQTQILNIITTVDIYIYIRVFYTTYSEDDLPISKHVATLKIKHT
jgi:hypothetical protein